MNIFKNRMVVGVFCIVLSLLICFGITPLFNKGINRMAQKVGEEAVETVIEATNGTEEGFLYEASDLVYHLIVLLRSKGYSLDDIGRELKKRHK